MEKLVVKGGKKLKGEIKVNGAKNAAVAIIPAVLLASKETVVRNLPHISDTRLLVDILKKIGAKCEFVGDILSVSDTKINEYKFEFDEVSKMRASYYFIGALLGRYRKVELPLPGGCNLGSRPIDQHIKAFEMLGAAVKIEHGLIKVEAKKLVGTKIYLDVVSVGATINTMLAAVLAQGETIIENVAKEPHVVDVADFLNKMGAKVQGAGTDIIKIEGVEKLGGCTHTVISDQIEAGTYMVAAAISDGDITIKNINPKHMESITAKLREANVEIIEISGATEVSPQLGLAEVIVDITSTGSTLQMNKLKIIAEIMESETVVIANKQIFKNAKEELDMFCLAIDSVMLAQNKKYLCANVPSASLEEIKSFLPGLAAPTVISLLDMPDQVAIQVVVDSDKVYQSIRKLKQLGGSGILIMSVDQMIK